MDAQNLIELFIGKALGHADADPNALVASLVAESVDSETAECLIAFVPMAFAHVILGALGVKLPERFELRDARTDAPVHGLLRDEPIFVAAQARARAMLAAGAGDRQSAQEIASTSAEWNAIAELVRDGSHPSDCGLTEATLMRLPADYLDKQKKHRSWWEIWRRRG